MNQDEYRKFWERFLGRYPDFKPTIEQTADWQRELINKDAHMLEAAVATVVTEKSSTQPRLPWFLDAYNRIRQKRGDKSRESANGGHSEFHISDEEIAYIKKERQNTVNFLKKANTEELRNATSRVLKKYGSVLNKPKDETDVETWSTWLRAAVSIEMRK
tara:strand:- start:859 stop:1338 length:480 start_codon:yes stop_codon:yes gene_type:complete